MGPGLGWLVCLAALSATLDDEWHQRLAPFLVEHSDARVPVSLQQVSCLLEEGDVGPACEALAIWPDREALFLRQVLTAAGHLHGALLLQALREGEVGQEAAAILEAQVAARAARVTPWRDPEPGRTDRQEDVHWFQPDGVYVCLMAPAKGLPMEELLQQVDEAGVWQAPTVVWPGALDSAEPVLGVVPPVPLRWFLERHLERRGLRAVRLFQATWILPEEGFEAWLEELPAETSERDAWRVLAHKERSLVRRLFPVLRARPTSLRAAEGALLLRSLGLDLGAPGGRVTEDPDQAALELVRAATQPGPTPHPRWRAPTGMPLLDTLRRRALLLAGVRHAEDPATDAWLVQRRAGAPARLPPAEVLARILEGAATYDRMGDLPVGLVPGRPLNPSMVGTPRALLHQAAHRARQDEDPAADVSALEAAVHAWVRGPLPDSLGVLAMALSQPGPWLDALVPILALEGGEAQVGALLQAAWQCSAEGSWSEPTILAFQDALVPLVAARLVRDPYLASTLGGRLRPVEQEQPVWGRLREQLRELARSLPPEQNWLLELRGLPAD